jgi:hypothetical protein
MSLSYLATRNPFLLLVDQGSHHCSSATFCSQYSCLKAPIWNPTQVWEEVPPVDLNGTHHNVHHSSLVDFLR